MQKIGLFVFCCFLSLGAHAQMTEAEALQKMRPEYRVDLSKTTTATTTTTTPARRTADSKAQLTQEITQLEAQYTRLEAMKAEQQRKIDTGDPAQDPMLQKYEQAQLHTKEQIEHKKNLLAKLSK